MSVTKNITDTNALVYKRARFDPLKGRFLHDLAIAELRDRLSIVRKDFKKISIVTGFPDIWSKEFPPAKIFPDTEFIDFQEDSFDLVVHAMALHWSNDPLGQMIQCFKVLKPDGLFLCVCPGGNTLRELRLAFFEAETKTSSGVSPRVLPMADIRDLGHLLQRVGFSMPVVDSIIIPATYETPLHLMRDLRSMGEGNAQIGRAKRFTPKKIIFETCEYYEQNYKKKCGRVSASFELLCLAGWKPAKNQPKPLRRGSATMSLAAVLENKETKQDD